MNNPPHGPPGYDREREREAEEQRRAHALQQQAELVQREREQNERQERERQHREHYQPVPPHQNDTASIPLHQPVASRLPGAIHSPGGLLANHGGAPPSGPLGAPSGPGNAFGGPLHNEANRAIQHNPQNAASQLQQQQGFGPSILHHNNAPPSVPIGPASTTGVGFGGPLQQQQQTQQQQQQEAMSRLQQLPFGGPIPQGHQISGAPAALGQAGQQPILNDALSYLDQVKVQFADQPDVYNRFLDIMKDFKSQAIDTPGVINRVSELFAGHPNLIQGFNTFLPPGYRIECGAGNDPNTIRVTTPMGTTVQSITGAGRALPDTPLGQGGANGGYYGSQQRHGNWQHQPQHSIESPEGVFSPQNQNAGPAYGQNQPPHSTYEAQQAAAAHQQQQRGVSQLTNAVATTLGHPPRNTQTPTPGGQASMNGATGQQGLEKRGPVEFNHAISYVNKIKNRFQDRPEIYKQFLEILQTYQRESKPIQDVYAQVTQLFNTAPDLLEDFKQFLPESAAQAKAAAQKAAEEAANMTGANQTPQASYARGESSKLPPVGNFAVPASASKDNKKRPRASNNATSGSQMNVMGEVQEELEVDRTTRYRTKLTHNKSAVPDAQAVSPTLTPVLPEPLPPNTTTAATQEELAFFDRVKKHIGDKKRMNEFLKLCNLFSQDMIDRDVLVHKASTFIGASSDLMTWFKDFVGYDGPTQEVMQPIDNRPKPPTERVSLSNCRGLGPSYRLLPKRERLKPCSGRDDMCNEILNDDWASHPTWASEDSGFVAHRKNVYEEGLHRIEEERHDYDFNIEANAKVIQLLEPIGQNLLGLNSEERAEFRMPIGLGGASQSIYKRVLKKIYGDRGLEVAADLFKDPGAVLPIVLARLKQKDEEWRFTQREWEKVWNAQTVSMYLRSLDHMGLSVKQADKRTFSQKHLIDAIKTKHEEQRRQRTMQRGDVLKYQYEFDFSDTEVIANVLRFMIIYANNAPQHNSHERRRITEFFEKFIPVFFGLSHETVAECTRDIDRGTPDDDFDDAAPHELPNGGRGRRPVNGRKNDLRRGVLDKNRNGTRGRGHKEDSTTGSKESTPDVESLDEDGGETADDRAVTEVTNERWASVPNAVAIHGTKELSAEDFKLKADQPFKQDVFSLYCNQTIYVFFTVFQTLYRRLKEVKESEPEAKAEGIRATEVKPAEKIGLMDNSKTDFHQPLNGETYYSRTLALVEDFVNNDLDEGKYHDFLRHFYLKKGWQLYTITDLLKALARLGSVCASVDAKEKTPDLLDQYYRNRELKEITYNTEINMRKQADKYIKDGELFLIQWTPAKSQATVRWVQRDETTFDLDDMERMARWQYYVSSYIRIEPTEGVNRGKMRKSLLTRNVPSPDTDAEEPKPLVFNENLTLQVCANSLKIIYKEGGTEFFIYTDKSLTRDSETGVSAARERLKKFEDVRTQKFKEKFEMNNAWMKGLDHDEVSKVSMEFKKWTDEGVLPGTEAPVASGAGDVEMIQ
ncbi:Paired amphipathic helix protein [Lachnellula subtilissima]|uniref:Paired amphipathic helix protein n=1 Tax=Lachnellula subtilissima TaxID=602034 RepID=A0A8H8UI21_9HELO|nr:Paired amphipathic helix protein [Lachnellula subtilissima]